MKKFNISCDISGRDIDEDFSNTVSFLRKGGWQHIIPKTKITADSEGED